MAQETICPACGAPLVITNPRDAVRCSFCGAELRMEGEGEQPDFRVVNQPAPQKETLSKPVEGRGDPTGATHVYAESGMENVNSVSPDQDPMRPAASFDSAPSFQPEIVPAGAAVYPAAGTERKGLSGTNRWIVIGGAVLLGLFLLCACLVAVVMVVMRNANF